MGCFKDDDLNREMNYNETAIENDNITINWCFNYCVQKNYDYFSTQNGNLCLCGNSYKSEYETDSCECNKSCLTQSDEICGGYLRNSIYKIFCKIILNYKKKIK